MENPNTNDTSLFMGAGRAILAAPLLCIITYRLGACAIDGCKFICNKDLPTLGKKICIVSAKAFLVLAALFIGLLALAKMELLVPFEEVGNLAITGAQLIAWAHILGFNTPLNNI